MIYARAFGTIINASEEQIMESVFSLGLMALGMVFTPLGVLPNTNLTKTYDPAFDLMGDVVINSVANDLDWLETISKQDVRPSNMICHINSSAEMTNSKGESLGEPYRDVFEWYLKGKMIPVWYIPDDASATDFISFYESVNIYDMGVMSSSTDVLKTVNASCPALHYIYDLSGATKDTLDLAAAVKDANMCGARTVVLPSALANYENIYYFQARFKSVWVDDIDADDIKIIQDVTDGAYGIISEDPVYAYSLLKVFSTASLEKRYNNNRPFLNIAHRGLCATDYENSLEGCIAAYEAGATHFEIDLQITKDQKIAIMHDDTIDRTTTGTGKISDYTAEELKQFRIDSTLSVKKSGEGVPIPMLDDIFTYFKGKDIVMILEIKTSDINIVSVLRDYIEQFDVFDQVVVISFYAAQLARMKQTLPEIPIADLNSYAEGTFMNSMETIGRNGMILDTNSANFSSSFVRILAERGFASFFWTYDNISRCYTGIKNGVLGLTNNLADTFKDYPISLVAEESYDCDVPFSEFTIELPYLTYGREVSEEKLTASVFYIEENEQYADVILQAKFSSGSATPSLKYVFYSDIVRLNKAEEAPTSVEISEQPQSSEPVTSISSGDTPVEPPKKSSATGLIIGCSVGGGALAIGVVVAAILVKRKRK